MIRWDWDTVWMAVANAMGKRSRCVRSQVGCVVVSHHNRVCSTGYNGPPAGLDVVGDCSEWCPRAKTGGAAAFYDDCRSSHAEMNALIMGDRSMYEGGTIYVTRVPCFTCAKVISNSGVHRVVCLIAPEDVDREPNRSLQEMRDAGLEVVELF